MIKVLIVDDHELVRTGIMRMLRDSAALEVVGQASSGEEALDMTRELAPDIVLMDVRMPGMGGLEATRMLRQRHPEVRVIAVTACEESPLPTRLLQAEASGYLSKSTAISEVQLAIELVYAGEYYISPEIARQMALQSIVSQSPDNPFASLSGREMQIALLISRGTRIQAIAEQLNLSPKTINTYRYRIFEKLGLANDVELALFAVKHGIIDLDNWESAK